MKSMWQNITKDYFTFSKKERNGILIMLLLSGITILISKYYPVARPHVDTSAFQKDLAKLTITIDTSHNGYSYNSDHVKYSSSNGIKGDYPDKGELFHFDPNTLAADGWKKLGVNERTVTTIHKFMNKGFIFKEPNDLRRIYGLKANLAERLIPYVRIAVNGSPKKTELTTTNYPIAKRYERENYKPSVVDINLADTSDFIALPGIGSKLASRIITFREKLGGFYAVNQVAETYGIPDSTFQKILPRLQCTNPAVKRININVADANELKMHPYIKWPVANAIVAYRSQHGAYKSIEDLRKIEILPDELITKIAPYLTF